MLNEDIKIMITDENLVFDFAMKVHRAGKYSLANHSVNRLGWRVYEFVSSDENLLPLEMRYEPKNRSVEIVWVHRRKDGKPIGMLAYYVIKEEGILFKSKRIAFSGALSI